MVYDTSHCANAEGSKGVPHRLMIPIDVTSPPRCAAQWGPGCACFSQGDFSQTCNDFPGKIPAMLPLHSHLMLEPANGFSQEPTPGDSVLGSQVGLSHLFVENTANLPGWEGKAELPWLPPLPLSSPLPSPPPPMHQGWRPSTPCSC